MLTSMLLTTMSFFFFNDTATTEIYTLSLHDALPIYGASRGSVRAAPAAAGAGRRRVSRAAEVIAASGRSEEHTSELQSRLHLVCRLLLEKKKNDTSVVQTLAQDYALAYRLYIIWHKI